MPCGVVTTQGVSQCHGRTSTMVNDTTPLKRCTKCGTEYPATTEYFYKHTSNKSGMYAHCKQCHNKMTAITSAAWQRANPDRVKEIQRRYQERHPERVAAWKRKYTERNRDKHYAAVAKWRRANPEAGRTVSQRYAARKRNLPSTLTTKQWLSCLEYWNHTCAYCGAQQSFWHVLEQEHHVPVSTGGGYTADNIVPACKSCNSRKLDRVASDWLIETFGKRKARAALERIEAYFEYIKSLAVQDE